MTPFCAACAIPARDALAHLPMWNGARAVGVVSHHQTLWSCVVPAKTEHRVGDTDSTNVRCVVARLQEGQHACVRTHEQELVNVKSQQPFRHAPVVLKKVLKDPHLGRLAFERNDGGASRKLGPSLQPASHRQPTFIIVNVKMLDTQQLVICQPLGQIRILITDIGEHRDSVHALRRLHCVFRLLFLLPDR